MKKITYWVVDYWYLLMGKLLMTIHRKPPKRYLNHATKGKNPIVIIQGKSNRWGFMKKLSDAMSKLGHPVYIAKDLGSNRFDIKTSAKIVRHVIEKNNLRNVILLGHSKGGIVGKYILINEDTGGRIDHLIAIAAPFSGSRIVYRFPRNKSLKEFAPKSKILREISSNKKVDSKIISIMPEFDNHIWADKGSYLDGATNVKLATKGHHKIVFDKRTIKKITELIESFN
jgi:triacylglycerol lipase